jgi:hypothetical protein
MLAGFMLFDNRICDGRDTLAAFFSCGPVKVYGVYGVVELG